MMNKEKIILFVVICILPFITGVYMAGYLFSDQTAGVKTSENNEFSIFAKPAIANVVPEEELNAQPRKNLMDTFRNPEPTSHSFPEETPSLRTEAVLTPEKSVVISSSHAGQIEKIPFSNGERFKKGDILVKYDCREIEAEKRIKEIEEQLAEIESKGSERLFSLDLISEFEKETAQVQKEKISLQRQALEARLDNCTIKAKFDGIVTDKLANPGEFTRTDRVLLEVVSLENLHAQILVPSIWLRWINIGAPVSIEIEETKKSYEAEIIRIHGEIDPVTKSVQVVASLLASEDKLLSGMSGIATLDIARIKEAGIKGYLVNTKEE